MKLVALKRFVAKLRARKRLLTDNPALARGVRDDWPTPPTLRTKGPPPRLPVAPTEELLRALDEDRADR